jgi:hypothetical protein
VTLYLFGTRLEPALQPWFGAGSSQPALAKSAYRTGVTTESAVSPTFLNGYAGRGCVLGEGSQLEPALVQRSGAGSYIANCLAPAGAPVAMSISSNETCYLGQGRSAPRGSSKPPRREIAAHSVHHAVCRDESELLPETGVANRPRRLRLKVKIFSGEHVNCLTVSTRLCATIGSKTVGTCAV